LDERFAQQTGVKISVSTMQQAVCKLKLSIKKRLIAVEQDTQRVKELRFAHRLQSFTSTPVTWSALMITGIYLVMTRLNGRTPSGKRIYNSKMPDDGARISR
jgi:hypothetical protein